MEIGTAIFVVHSLAGAFGPLMALDYPQRVAGLVMLAPVAYPWPGGGFAMVRVIRMCQDSVTDRLSSQGYQHIMFERTKPVPGSN